MVTDLATVHRLWFHEVADVCLVPTQKVRELALASGLPQQKIQITGIYDQLNQMEWHLTAHIHNFVTDMPTLMHAADCVVCKAGGLIVTEALACGLPLLLVDVLPGQETGNADYVIEEGAGELARSSIDALEIIYHWLDQDGRPLAERAQNACRLGRPRAAYDIAERAWAMARLGPEAREGRHAHLRPRLVELLNRYGVTWQSDA